MRDCIDGARFLGLTLYQVSIVWIKGYQTQLKCYQDWRATVAEPSVHERTWPPVRVIVAVSQASNVQSNVERDNQS